MSLKFWHDPISEPSRSVYYILKKLDIEHELIEVAIVKGTRTEEFKKDVNPAGLIPVIEHECQKIYESSCIIRYLLDTFDSNETLLPRSDLKKRAGVDYWLDWRNTTYRQASDIAIMQMVVNPMFLGADKPSEEEQKEMVSKCEEHLKTIEAVVSEQPYLTGEDLTIADVYLYNEILEGIHLLKVTVEGKVKEWLDRVNTDEVVKELTDVLLDILSKM
mmetsp:Transcript_2439/g.2865  ORF Transcript_2439/g.2865 Transcript_2439/m.2865 type:complete len:218 (-) Transcript_2439:37-690(-)|eukprot:CAMPEP_0205820532 /NCGR_PEP_ID=MMETSP0206-20130828/3186_1 /ASSEMBLY_ACC=CAM_ASM_000279 /TAXON_ID=36767 /ORGANISM="Euplotes focardii, Strain TN1" /LENGTH=217 /DNA_ID=CAMNT_0053115345 /DNA_START=35 /DNA_END=688 /DNA_ORIENTATION=+